MNNVITATSKTHTGLRAFCIGLLLPLALAPAAEFAAFVQAESKKWAGLAKERGLRVE